ncbi:MAG TPA: hypothetical protein VHY48_07345 [Acidobacteriaceae bacterium]|jgi:hypothetical protein|nr:hypothetical protein [Acidobacteriaceae bacterium]
MSRRSILAVAAGLAFSLAAAPKAGAQGSTAVAQPDASVGAALQNIASRAAIVFAGQVVSIQRHAGVVEITWRIDTPVRGQMGATYTLREWAGMWPPGQWRYSVGERALIFLHGASQAGFSSAVDGDEGVVPLVRGADGTPLLDVRRLSTRVLRQIGQPLPDASESAISLADAVTLVNTSGSSGHPPLREPVRRPLPPGVGVTPRRSSAVSGQPTTQVSIQPSRSQYSMFVLRQGSYGAQ